MSPPGDARTPPEAVSVGTPLPWGPFSPPLYKSLSTPDVRTSLLGCLEDYLLFRQSGERYCSSYHIRL
eukprot:4441187-Prymnesium_polylepis.1